MNILEESSIANCLKGKDINVIIHLAALNEIDSMKDPKLALEVNTKGTYKLLDLAYKTGIKNFIYFSTFHVYGDVFRISYYRGNTYKAFSSICDNTSSC